MNPIYYQRAANIVAEYIRRDRLDVGYPVREAFVAFFRDSLGFDVKAFREACEPK